MNYKDINDYELLYMIKENDDYSKNILFLKYDYIVKKIVSKYTSFAFKKGADFDDLVQEGYIGLLSAIKDYNDKFVCKFYSFACLCIERQVNSYCKKLSTNKNDVLNLAMYLDFELVSNYFVSKDSFSYLNEHDFFYKIINLLSFKQSMVFELKYNGFSYNEISNLLGIPVNTVDSRLCKIRQILKKVS